MDKTNFDRIFPSMVNHLCNRVNVSRYCLDKAIVERDYIPKYKLWFYKCCKCGKETFVDLNNIGEPRLCLNCNGQRVMDAMNLHLPHDEEPRGQEGSYHNGLYEKKKGYIFDKDCPRCNLEKDLGL